MKRRLPRPTKKRCRWCHVKFETYDAEAACLYHREPWNPEEGETVQDDVAVLSARLNAVLERLEQVEKGDKT